MLRACGVARYGLDVAGVCVLAATGVGHIDLDPDPDIDVADEIVPDYLDTLDVPDVLGVNRLAEDQVPCARPPRKADFLRRAAVASELQLEQTPFSHGATVACLAVLHLY